jgi:hypothetical protein
MPPRIYPDRTLSLAERQERWRLRRKGLLPPVPRRSKTGPFLTWEDVEAFLVGSDNAAVAEEPGQNDGGPHVHLERRVR